LPNNLKPQAALMAIIRLGRRRSRRTRRQKPKGVSWCCCHCFCCYCGVNVVVVAALLTLLMEILLCFTKKKNEESKTYPEACRSSNALKYNRWNISLKSIMNWFIEHFVISLQFDL